MRTCPGFVEGCGLGIRVSGLDAFLLSCLLVQGLRRRRPEQFDRFPLLAADPVRRPVNAIVAGGQTTVLAAKAATGAIPIIFQTKADPVETELR